MFINKLVTHSEVVKLWVVLGIQGDNRYVHVIQS